MRLARLVTWNRDEAPERAQALEAAGFEVDVSPFPSAQTIGHIRDLSPAIVVIDLDRLPSHGRAVATALRSTKSTRQFPIVFAGGAEEKIERVRKDFPDAVLTDWKTIGRVIKHVVKNGPAAPLKTTPYMQQWEGSSLVKKLGLKDAVALLNAPDGFEDVLGELPEGVALKTALTKQTKLAIWFVRSRAELEDETPFLSVRLPDGCHLWIAHPKQAGRYRADFNQNDVRNTALAAGLVDYKVCAVDADWSALKFARKK
jgi:CheY-like chemotaxis protein